MIMMKNIFNYLFFSFIILSVTDCQNKPKSDINEFDTQKLLIETSPFKDLKWRSIGPDFRSGRSTDIWGVTGDTNIIYAAFATGGLWKTVDGGQSWTSLFEKEATLSIGNIAVYSKDPNVVYVGTGEANIFRASLPGVGVYKTIDGGTTFQHIGLSKSGTISRIVIDPNDQNHVYVAAVGNEWTTNEDRGLYESKNGGKTWTKILYENEQSGCIDLVMDPSDSKILYASMWNRIRKRWSDPMPEDGDHLYKSVDGGANWKIINQGLPNTKLTGRIGLAVSKSKPNVIYAFVDDHNKKRDPEPNETDSYERKVQKVVIGGAIYRSDDKGETWQKQAEIHDFFKPFSGTYGWVFSQIRVNPINENEVYVLGVNMGKSIDGGKTWTKFEAKEDFIHGDNHGMWFDEKNPKRILLANDGGVSRTLDGGIRWKNFFDKIPTTQFYTITYDMASPFNIYGSVQDEGTLGGSSAETFGVPKDTTLKKWDYAPGGEGTQIRVDPKNNDIIYSCSYYGRLMKTDISKSEEVGKEKFKIFDVGRIDSLRGEWLAGTMISKFDNKVIYHGLQHLYQSKDAGKSWKIISPDLTSNDKTKMGVYPYLIYHQAITCIEEGSRHDELFVGTDDGRIWYTNDEGKSWKEITKGLPTNKHIIKIVSSKHNHDKLYVALNDRRSDNHEAMIYVSMDRGQSWASVSSNLPKSPVNVILEDRMKAGKLYCGTDMGPYMSNDGGKNWISLTGNLPYALSINDMFIHPRDNKLVLGTYGRGVYILDDMSILK
jgi:photosystem II stability/assembly factor-like uncharacterized protein